MNNGKMQINKDLQIKLTISNTKINKEFKKKTNN